MGNVAFCISHGGNLLSVDFSYIFGIHPHGVMPFGAIAAFIDEHSEDSFKNIMESTCKMSHNF